MFQKLKSVKYKKHNATVINAITLSSEINLFRLCFINFDINRNETIRINKYLCVYPFHILILFKNYWSERATPRHSRKIIRLPVYYKDWDTYSSQVCAKCIVCTSIVISCNLCPLVFNVFSFHVWQVVPLLAFTFEIYKQKNLVVI